MIAFSSKSSIWEGARRRGKSRKSDLTATLADDRRGCLEDGEDESDAEAATLEAFRTALIERNLLPPRHDDCHTLRRSVSVVALVTLLINYLILVRRFECAYSWSWEELLVYSWNMFECRCWCNGAGNVMDLQLELPLNRKFWDGSDSGAKWDVCYMILQIQLVKN